MEMNGLTYCQRAAAAVLLAMPTTSQPASNQAGHDRSANQTGRSNHEHPHASMRLPIVTREGLTFTGDAR